uniref:ABC transporter domain-containing protein n=1 Tax=Panagrellus redivivus TaxID=6233 RepID=A0A7E4W542_PANRE
MVRPFTKWTIRVQNKEADFRYKHVNLRDNSESVAMYSSEAFEKTECERFFEVAIHTRYWTLFYNVLSVISDTFFNDFSDPIRYIVLSIPIIYFGSYDGVSQDSLAGTITTYASMLSHLLEVLTACASVIFAYSRLAGSAKRVYDFMCYTEDGPKPEGGDYGSKTKCDDILYEFDRVTYCTPNNGGKVLLKDFTLKVNQNKNVLITGPSGAGKTAFLRIISKIWPIKTGVLTVNAYHYDILPIPSNLYMPNGRLTLKQQIIFPLTVDKASKCFDDQQIMAIIKELSLDSVLHLCNGLDSIVDFEWAERLSLAQQQRIGFARILYHRPELALLDEATNCLSPAAEREMYMMLQKRGISYISTGNQPLLRPCHDIEVKLNGWGGYEVFDLSKSNADKGMVLP